MARLIQKRRKGFTIIELMLAMGFLSALLVTIAFLVLQITGIYQKGLTLRAISSTGKQLIDEMSRVVAGSPIPKVPIMPATDGGDAAIKTALSRYFVQRGVANGVQHSGTFCTGSYSYIWNTWYAYGENEGANTLKLRVNNQVRGAYKLARVIDTERNVCAQASGAVDPVNNTPRTTIDVPVTSGEPIELINSDESDLILYDFTVFPASQQTVTGQIFYSATFILATIRGGVNIVSSGDFCSLDGGNGIGLSSEFNYCAVNKFNFAMRATGFSDGEDMFGERGD